MMILQISILRLQIKYLQFYNFIVNKISCGIFLVKIQIVFEIHFKTGENYISLFDGDETGDLGFDDFAKMGAGNWSRSLVRFVRA